MTKLFDDLLDPPTFSAAEEHSERRKSVCRCIVVVAHGESEVLLCEEGGPLECVDGGSSVDGFTPGKDSVEVQGAEGLMGVFVGELVIVDGGPESWEMPYIRDYYPEIRNLQPITKDEWKSHLVGEWPKGWNDLTSEGDQRP